MAITIAKGVKAGQIESVGEPVTETNNNAVNNQAFVAGDILHLDSQTFKWRKCTSGDIKPFAVCTKDKASTDTRVEFVRRQGIQVYVTADGNINPFTRVIPSTATDGQVQQKNDSGSSLAAGDNVIGIYLKRAQYVPEGHGAITAVGAVDNDIIKIELL